uniref:DUF4258 domain-containing protein n=1 Tax=Globodera pallida TaxID=36090 RepID=A0A183BQ42_GLOPA
MAAIQRFSGRINAKKVVEELKKRKLDAEWTGDEEISIRDYSARIHILGSGSRTLITCSNPANRREIQAAIQASCLARFDVQATQQSLQTDSHSTGPITD